MTQSVDDYFTRFQDFEEDPQASLLTEFSRLALDQGWDNRTRAEERRSCLIAQLNVHVGSTGTGGQRDQLARLQRLCEELRVSPIPTSITQCKKVKPDT